MGGYYIYIYSLIYAALKYLSDGADDEFQIFIYRYLSGMVKVLEKCQQVSQFNTRF